MSEEFDAEVTQWIRKLGEGSDRAAQELWNQYFEKLVGLVRARLRNVPKRSFDEEDIALSAMNSLILGVRDNRFPDVSSRHNLWNLLVAITATKVAGEQRRQTAKKRGSGKVRGESVFEGLGKDHLGLGQVLGREPTPELAAQVSETCRHLLDALQDDGLEQVALLKIEGYSNEEIAHRIDRGVSTVERRLKRIREKWTKLV